MRRSLALLTVLLVTAAGCSNKQTSSTATSGSDSLLASNPVEQPQGNITPQSQYNPPAATNQTPPPAAEQAPATRPAASTSHARTRHHESEATASHAAENAGVTVAEGTAITVNVGTQLSSKTANVGDTWTGTVKDPVIVGDRVVFPAGAMVSGVVTDAKAAEKGDRATLGISVTSISVNGVSHAVDASTEPIIAGSTRARNLGAMAGGAAAGALIGHAIGGGKGTLIGGLIGAAGAGAGVAASKGYQVVIKEGTVLTFDVKKPVTVRS